MPNWVRQVQYRQRKARPETAGGQGRSAHSNRFASEERVSVDGEAPGALLAVRSPKGVDRWPYLHADEPDLFKHVLPGCTRQTTGNSCRPKFDILNCRGRDRIAVCDV